MALTAFEQQLEQYFPDIYQLHQLSKSEKHIWKVMESFIEYSKGNTTGMIQVQYDNGKISRVIISENVTAHTTGSQNHNSPSIIDNL